MDTSAQTIPTSPAEPVRVLIIDDDYYAREALRSLVARDTRTRVWDARESIDEAHSALRSSGAARKPLPDVILLDVRLAGDERAGIEGIAHLKESSPISRILMISVDRTDETVLAALRAGADGYVWKNESTDGIVDAIVRTADGRFVMTASVASHVLAAVSQFGTDRLVVDVLPDPAQRAELTESVRKTVYLYCYSGMSAREIADELQISVNTVNSRLKAAYDALDVSSRHDAFQRLVQRGSQR